MFGQSSAFGANKPSAFGASTFGATQPAQQSAFGATNTGFGAAAQPNAFGAANTSSTGLFGQQQPQQQQQGLFGNTGQQQQPPPAFGSTASAFGAGSSSFGASSAFKPATNTLGGFGTATSTAGGMFGSTTAPQSGGLFGQQQQQQQQAQPFGAPTGFGGATSAFGVQQNTAQNQGTTIKFNPVAGTDTMMKSGVTQNINTRHQCISCMKEYENFSLEELRCQDYIAGRKTGGQAGMSGGGLFGATAVAPNQSVGGFFSSNPTSTQGGMFGAQQNQNKPMFGGTTSTFGTPASSATPFGVTGQQSAFGASNTSTGLFGSKPTAFGAPQQSTAGGFAGFGANTATSTGGGLFGQQNKPLGFGTPSTQAGGLFGSQAGGFGAPQQQAPAFGTATGGFGMQNQQQNSSIGLFGQQQNKPTLGFGTTGGTAFGAPASSAPAFGGFGTNTMTNTFGQQQKPPAFGSAFGTGTAGAPTGFGGFGATSQPQQSGSLFGNQAKPTLGFGGGLTTNQPATSFSGFGAPAANTGGSLFGGGLGQAKPGGMFGGATGTNTGFGGTTGGFGSFGTSGGFGASTGFSAGGGNTMFGGANSAFQTQPQQQQQQQSGAVNPIQQQLVHLSNSPYGDNPLFKNLFDSGKREDILKPINPVAQKALEANQYKISPHRNIKVKAKPIKSLGNKSGIFDGLEDDDIDPKNDLFVPRSSVKKLVLKPKSPNISAGRVTESNETMGNNSVSSPPNNILDTTENRSLDESLNLPCIKSRKDVIAPKVGGVEDHDETIQLLNAKNKKAAAEDAAKKSNDIQNNEEEDDEEDFAPQHPAGVVLRRAGYYTIPPLDEMTTLIDENGACNVENFTIGRKGYGNIYFKGTTDVSNMNLDEIVHIQHKQVNVYPDDSKKPELGYGLNKKAQITLDQVWPVDKTTRNFIKDQDKLNAMKFEDKLIRNCIRNGARFVEYRIETGSWVFKVDHFSKYGLDDSDDEDKFPAAKQDLKKLKTLQPRDPLKVNELPSSAVKKLDTKVVTLAKVDDKQPAAGSSSPSTQLLTVQTDDESNEMNHSGQVSPPVQQLSKINAPRNRVQLMKASLFDDDDDDNMDMSVSKTRPVILEARPTILEKRDPLIEDIARSILHGSDSKGLGGSSGVFGMDHHSSNAAANLLRTRFMPTSGLERSSILERSSFNQSSSSMLTSSQFGIASYSLHEGYEKYISLPSSGQTQKTKAVIPKFGSTLKPLKESVFALRLKCLADSGLQMSRRFRVGWGPNWTLANSGRPAADNRDFIQCTFYNVHMEQTSISSCGLIDNLQIQSVESWLEVSLENSFFNQDREENPRIEPVMGVDSLQSHAAEASKQLAETKSADRLFGRAMKETQAIWDLCLALWGRIEEQEIFDHRSDSHEVTMLRKEALTKWLQHNVELEVREKVKKAKQIGNHVQEVLALLSGNKVEEACEVSQAAGDHFVALLMATSGGYNSLNGKYILEQLERWQEMGADEFITEERIQLYSTLAGIPVWQTSKHPVNICENLDWKRALGIHLWYLTSPVSSISDAFLGYENAFEGEDVYAVQPEPEYFISNKTRNTSEKCDAYDIKYHLMKLYTNRSHSLEKLLNPITHTPDHIDYRLSWFLHQVLISLGYGHMSSVKEAELHLSFASQLESFGLWHWSVYILMHLQDDFLRKSKVLQVLGLNVRLNDEDCSERELFLSEQLHVPFTWIAEAKAVRALAEQNFKDQAWYLIQARQWNEAHKVIMKSIAPDAIINEDYEFLLELLNYLSDPEISHSILDWNSNGQVFFDFINVDMEVQELLAKRDETQLSYSIEKLRPKVTNLCSRISSLKVNTAEERLCQSEIAKKVAHLMRAILSLETSANFGSSKAKKHEASRILAQNLSQLPLPDDYALQELRSLTRSYMMEIIES